MDLLVKKQRLDELVGVDPYERVEAMSEWEDEAAAEIKRLREVLQRIEREGAGLWLGQIAANALEEK